MYPKGERERGNRESGWEKERVREASKEISLHIITSFSRRIVEKEEAAQQSKGLSSMEKRGLLLQWYSATAEVMPAFLGKRAIFHICFIFIIQIIRRFGISRFRTS